MFLMWLAWIALIAVCFGDSVYLASPWKTVPLGWLIPRAVLVIVSVVWAVIAVSKVGLF